MILAFEILIGALAVFATFWVTRAFVLTFRSLSIPTEEEIESL